ncbi:hypothetical protein ACJD0Z_06570 [Flavobacteriaceae bacterium M23B6Z8]
MTINKMKGKIIYIKSGTKSGKIIEETEKKQFNFDFDSFCNIFQKIYIGMPVVFDVMELNGVLKAVNIVVENTYWEDS